MGKMQLYLYRPMYDAENLDDNADEKRRPFTTDLSILKKKKKEVDYFTSEAVAVPAVSMPMCQYSDDFYYSRNSRIEVTFTFSNYKLDFDKTDIIDVVNRYLLRLSGVIYNFIVTDEKELFIDNIKTTKPLKMPQMLQEDLPNIFVSFAIVFENCEISGNYTKELDVNELAFYFRYDEGLNYRNFESYFQFLNTNADYINVPTAREVYIIDSSISRFYVRNIFDIHLKNSSVLFVSDMPIDNLPDLANQRGNQELLVKYALPEDINTKYTDYYWRNGVAITFADFLGINSTMQKYDTLLYDHLSYSEAIYKYIEDADRSSSSSEIFTLSSNLSILKTMLEGTFIHKDKDSSCVCFSDATGFSTMYDDGNDALLTDYGAYIYYSILGDTPPIYYGEVVKREFFAVLPYRENYYSSGALDQSTIKIERLTGNTNSIYTDLVGYFKRKKE